MTTDGSARQLPLAAEPARPQQPSPSGLARWCWLLLVPFAALAQSTGGSYTQRKHVVASGVVASGGSYRLTGTVGQPAAAVQQAGSYRLTGGFHGPTAAAGDRLLCSGFENTPCP